MLLCHLFKYWELGIAVLTSEPSIDQADRFLDEPLRLINLLDTSNEVVRSF